MQHSRMSSTASPAMRTSGGSASRTIFCSVAAVQRSVSARHAALHWSSSTGHACHLWADWLHQPPSPGTRSCYTAGRGAHKRTVQWRACSWACMLAACLPGSVSQCSSAPLRFLIDRISYDRLKPFGGLQTISAPRTTSWPLPLQQVAPDSVFFKMAATMIAKTSAFMGVKPVQAKQPKAVAGRGTMVVRAGAYDEELISTAVRARMRPCARTRPVQKPRAGLI